MKGVKEGRRYTEGASTQLENWALEVLLLASRFVVDVMSGQFYPSTVVHMSSKCSSGSGATTVHSAKLFCDTRF